MVGGVVSVVTGVINPFIGKVITRSALMGDESRKFKFLRKQASFLEKELSAMNFALQNLELVDERDPAVKDWIDHAREMSKKIEDCIDDFVHQYGHEDADAGFFRRTIRYLRFRRLQQRHQIAIRIEEFKTLAIDANARWEKLTMDGQDALRGRKPHGIQHPERGPVLQEITTDLTADSVNINSVQEITADWTDASENIRPIRAAGAGNVEDYVSDGFVAEAMDEMQAAVSRREELRSNSQLPTIYPVSTEHNGNCENDGIKPVAVRIGLLNWSEHDQSKEKLQDYKWYCVRQLIDRHSSVLEPARTPLLLRKCLNTMSQMESEIRRFYSRGNVILIDSNKLALMMVLDGCFILHFLLKYTDDVRENEADSTERLYGSPQEWEFVKRDLLLFENQIPFLVLRKLLDKLEIDEESEHNLVKGSLRLFRSSCCCCRMLHSEFSESDMAGDQVDHLLHLFYRSVALPPEPSDLAAHVALSIDPQGMFCTKELEEAGVRFRKREQARSFLDIKFDHGVLEIPPLLLDEFSNVLFRNLVAFEKSCTTSRQCISSYAAFMGDLMQTPEDRQILRRHGILVNLRDTSSFFNGTGIRMLLPSDNYLVPLMENLRKYKDSRRHGWRAELMRSYFRNPWVAISVLAAVIVLVMTVLQTVFTVYGYYKPRK